jgi:hypothetical protein
VRIEAMTVQDPRPKRPYDMRLQEVGDALRQSWQTPTDTMITGDIPTLLTLLSKVPKDRHRR